jgi:hypothetical protein
VIESVARGLCVVFVVGCTSKTSTPSPQTPVTNSPGKPVDPVVTAPLDPTGPPPIAIGTEPPVAGDIGSSGTLWVMAAAPNGSWVLACDARKDTDKDGKIGVSYGHHGELFGDEPAPYLIAGPGMGEELDAVAGVDPKHRYIVVAHKTSLEVLDTETRAKTPLSGADLSYENGAFGGARVAFDASGTHVLYTRTPKKSSSTIVVRRLVDGVEHEIATGPGRLQSVSIVGGFVVADVFDPKPGYSYGVSSGRSGPSHTVGGRRCRVDRLNAPTNGEDRFAPLATGGTAKAVKGAIVVGAGLIVPAADGALALERDGKSLPIADAACGAVVIARSHPNESILYACGKTARADEPTELRLWRDGASKPLGVKTAIPDRPLDNEYAQYGDRMARVESTMIDLVSGRTRALKEHYPIATFGSKVLLHHRERNFAVYDLATGGWVDLPTTPPDMMISAQQGRIFAAGRRPEADTPPGVVVDLEASAELGTFEGQAQAVSETGWILALEKGKPLRWVRPTTKQSGA